MSTTVAATMAATSSSLPVAFPASRCSSPASFAGLSDRIVRFNTECVLIPESPCRSRRPRMVTKSYSLPLWKKNHKASNSVTSDSEPETSEDTHLVFKVPVPIFLSRSRSTSRGAEPPSQPLSSCLVQREPSSPPVRRPIIRSPSLPLRPRQDVVTVPLRACCQDCVTITEECLKEGKEWQEKFSRGARRLRTASLETTSLGSTSGFATVSCSDNEAVVGAGFHGGVMINVDEVDKRRQSHEDEEQEEKWEDALEEPSSESNSSSKDPLCEDELKDLGMFKASPIEEEDEDQLFPLPSPRRSPCSSPIPSPNTSLACLGASASRDSLQNAGDGSPCGSDESGGSRSSTTGKRRCKNGLLTPDPSPLLPNYVPPSLTAVASACSTPSFQLPTPLPSPIAPPAKPATAPIAIPSTPRSQRRHSYHLQQYSSSSTASTTTSTSTPAPSTPPSPTIPLRRSSSTSQRKRASMYIPRPAFFLKAGTDMLKGITSLSAPGGTALST